METITRTSCCINGANDLEFLHKLKNFPVFMGCVDEDINADLKVDMEWYISKSSGAIQLKNLIPLDILYPEQHDAGVIGSIWEKHHKEFSKFLMEYVRDEVLEIGGAHGILSKECNKVRNIDWTIIEPNPSPVENCPAKFIKGFFGDSDYDLPNADVIVHSHVLEHIYKPDEFMQLISNICEIGEMHIFSLPNMKVMLERKYPNCINFEHSVLITEDYIDYLLKKNGFKVIKKKRFLEDHSLFYSTQKVDFKENIVLSKSIYNENKKIYLEFVKYHEDLVVEINNKIKEHGGLAYLFGAHIFSQYLLQCGLKEENIESILDNNQTKHNKRLYGTSLNVRSPQVLSNIEKPLIILKMGVYNNEVKKDILENINSEAIFI